MKYAPLFIALCLAPFPAMAEEGRAHSADEKRSAIDAHLKCLDAAARQMDDGISPADAVGAAIAPMCQREFTAAFETFGPFRSKRAKRMTYDMMSANAEKTATRIVLLSRR